MKKRVSSSNATGNRKGIILAVSLAVTLLIFSLPFLMSDADDGTDAAFASSGQSTSIALKDDAINADGQLGSGNTGDDDGPDTVLIIVAVAVLLGIGGVGWALTRRK